MIQQVREFLYFDPFFYDFDPQKKFSETNSDRKTEIWHFLNNIIDYILKFLLRYVFMSFELELSTAHL